MKIVMNGVTGYGIKSIAENAVMSEVKSGMRNGVMSGVNSGM